jgi:zinc transport system substrate-binding protein
VRDVKRIVLILVSVALGLLAAGCGSDDETSSGRQVVAAFYPLAFAAEQIADGAEVVNLTPTGAEPHDLELSARDIETVQAAYLLLYLGRGFQPGLEDALAGRTGPSLDVLEGLELLEGGEDGHDHGAEEEQAEEEHADEDHAEEAGLDPHVWLDPMRYAAMAEAIATELGEPEAAADLVARLDELDTELQAGLAQCERREIVTSHAAFGYLADRYDLTQIPLTGLSPEAEPSPKDLAALVDEVKEEGATTVFFETLVSPDLAETVAREAGAKTAVLNPLEGLTAEQADEGDDYFSVMRENLAVLREALGCI